MNVRYTMHETSENFFKDERCLNLNNLRSEYNISKRTNSGDSSYNSATDCSYCRAMENRSMTAAAGLKIFTSVLLHAWRKRRDEIKTLLQTVNELKQDSTRTKNQLHVYNSLIRVEQKRNDQLTSQLSRTLDNLKKTRASCESMSATVISLKADKALLEQELKDKYQEYDSLHAVLAQTKTDLFRSMMEQRNLQSQLCKEQRMVQSLENQKTKLLSEISDIKMEHCQVEEHLTRKLIEKECDLDKHNCVIAEPDTYLANYQEGSVGGATQKTDEINNKQVKLLRLQVVALQSNLENTLCHRLRSYWKQFWEYQKCTFRYIHILAYYLLPATPPPQILGCKSKERLWL